jgi:hypothetical protein
VGKERAEGILFEMEGVGGEHQEFVLGGMGETNPRKANEDNKIQENTRNCPVRGYIIVVNFELQEVSVNRVKKFSETSPAYHAACKQDVVCVADGRQGMGERVWEPQLVRDTCPFEADE